ncbi:T9SS type A sorting domain-containing protein [Rasiella sp. SM2506]|uniref:T9SS type A sorting domain-containing protein n=1 Tax=Rasiella sp. SM2506 TaxID=3423914 RepID=UPI003D7AB508
MIPKLIVLFSILFSSSISAQDPDLVGDWQLTELIMDGTSFIPPSDSEVELVTLEIALSGVENFRTSVCDLLSGDISFIGVNQFALTMVSQTLGGCFENNNQDIQGVYFDFYNQNVGDFMYEIEDLGNTIKKLTITDATGNEAIYHSELLRQYVFKRWYLQKLILGGSDFNVPGEQDSFSPSIVFEQTFDPATATFSGQSGCNNFTGENTFVSNVREVTITQNNLASDPCANETQTDFEALYTDFLFGNLPETFNYLLVEPGDETIFYLQNANNDYAIYGENPINLGVAENEIGSVRLFPNPAGNEIFIEANLPLEKVEIYSVSGKFIRAETDLSNAVDISSFPSGLYFIKIRSSGSTLTKKFIKN